MKKELSSLKKYITTQLSRRSHDNKSLAPLMLRFAWHACGTYDCSDNSGGSNGGTLMREAERSDPENSGFEKAYELLENIHQKFGNVLSYADLIVLCGHVSIQAMHGPVIPFSYGRVDFTDEEAEERYGKKCGGCPVGDGKYHPQGSRLPCPDVGKKDEFAEPRLREKPTIDSVRCTFQRMGFNDKETVCLIVFGHQFGRCHPEVSGYEYARYPFDPTHWNIYESGLGYLTAMLTGEYQEVLSCTGKRQFVMNFGGGEPFMLLISDMVLLWDHSYREHLLWYDQHREEFQDDAVAVWKKLTELGCDGLLTPEDT